MAKVKKLIFNCSLVCFAVALMCQTAFAAGRTLVPVGDAVGISLETEGVLVVGFPNDNDSSARKAGVRLGDVIVKIDDTAIKNGSDMGNIVLTGAPVTVTVMRNREERQLTVTPDIGFDGEPELGLLLRDGISGIGTITFYDPETGVFGALGHSINDVDTGVTMPIGGGILAEATVTDIVEGRCGFPGQLSGVFDFSSVIGIISENTVCGIFGTVTDTAAIENINAVEIADAQEIHTGSAAIISCVDGKGPQWYDVEITRVDIGNSEGHSFMLRVTDNDLIDKTGGIVQGMSGSPIIQDGKLIGAVTHVLVNDPTTGYGIFIENMLEAAG